MAGGWRRAAQPVVRESVFHAAAAIEPRAIARETRRERAGLNGRCGVVNLVAGRDCLAEFVGAAVPLPAAGGAVR